MLPIINGLASLTDRQPSIMCEWMPARLRVPPVDALDTSSPYSKHGPRIHPITLRPSLDTAHALVRYMCTHTRRPCTDDGQRARSSPFDLVRGSAALTCGAPQKPAEPWRHETIAQKRSSRSNLRRVYYSAYYAIIHGDRLVKSPTWSRFRDCLTWPTYQAKAPGRCFRSLH